jgi:hypothetical protein
MGRRASTSAARWLLLAGLGWDVPETYVSARPPDVPRGNTRAAPNTCSVPDAHTPIMHEARPARCAGDHRASASSALPSLTRAGQPTPPRGSRAQRSIYHDCIPAPGPRNHRLLLTCLLPPSTVISASPTARLIAPSRARSPRHLLSHSKPALASRSDRHDIHP